MTGRERGTKEEKMKDPYDVRSEECKPCGQERASQKEREERERETLSLRVWSKRMLMSSYSAVTSRCHNAVSLVTVLY